MTPESLDNMTYRRLGHMLINAELGGFLFFIVEGDEDGDDGEDGSKSCRWCLYHGDSLGMPQIVLSSAIDRYSRSGGGG